MDKKTVYIKGKRNTQVMCRDVYLKDIATVNCSDENITARLNAMKVYKFRQDAQKGKNGENRTVISILYLISRIEQAEKNVQVESLGEQDMLVQMVEPEKGRIWKRAQIVFVSMIAFFGTAFTIMAFHNDIGIHKVFERVFTLVIGHDTNNFTVLEVAYSIGLCIGIVLFFNHIGKRRITRDPTPIEVEMFLYEKNVDDTLVETADKEGRTIDAP